MPLKKSAYSQTWCNSVDYSDKAKPVFWCEITKFIFPSNPTKECYRVWVIQTPDGKFSHRAEDKVKSFCNGHSMNLNFEQAVELIEEVLTSFIRYPVKLQLN